MTWESAKGSDRTGTTTGAGTCVASARRCRAKCVFRIEVHGRAKLGGRAESRSLSHEQVTLLHVVVNELGLERLAGGKELHVARIEPHGIVEVHEGIREAFTFVELDAALVGFAGLLSSFFVGMQLMLPISPLAQVIGGEEEVSFARTSAGMAVIAATHTAAIMLDLRPISADSNV